MGVLDSHARQKTPVIDLQSASDLEYCRFGVNQCVSGLADWHLAAISDGHYLL
jgi:hypothetical protein